MNASFSDWLESDVRPLCGGAMAWDPPPRQTALLDFIVELTISPPPMLSPWELR